MLASNYADDVMCATASKIEKMGDLFAAPDGPEVWAATYHPPYPFHKFAALGLTRCRVPDPDRPGHMMKRPPMEFTLGVGHQVRMIHSHKFLGVIMDEKLWHKPGSIETIGTSAETPSWESHITTEIPSTKEEAIQGDLADEANVKIYSRSGYHNAPSCPTSSTRSMKVRRSAAGFRPAQKRDSEP